MKYISIATLYVFMLAISACSTPEQAADTSEPYETIVKTAAPDWYSPAVLSKTDSTAFHGYSLAMAADSAEALLLSTNGALTNLRFEIDSTLEQIRKELADEPSGSLYQQPSFIIDLRNIVQDLDLSEAEVTVYYEPDSGDVFYVYTHVEVMKETVFEQVHGLEGVDRRILNVD